MIKSELLKKVRVSANAGLIRNGYHVFMVESPHDKKCYTQALEKKLGTKLAEAEIYFYSPVDIHSFYQTIGTLTEKDIEEFSKKEVGRFAVEHFIEDTQGYCGAYGIVDRDLLGDDGKRNDPPNLQLTDSCDVDSEILCCLPRLLERTVMDKANRIRTFDDSDERIYYANAVCSAYRLGKLLNCETFISAEFKDSGERDVIENFFEASKRRHGLLPSFLSDQKILSFSKWCAVSADYAENIDSSLLNEIKILVKKTLSGDLFCQDNQNERSLADAGFNTAVETKTFEERNTIWRFCNGHDLVIFLGENFKKECFPRDSENTEKYFAELFVKSSQAIKVFWKTPLGEWIKICLAQAT